MTMQAKGHRHLKKVWQGDRAWEWAVLCYGHAQPKRFYLGAGPWSRRSIRFHLTPFHFERWGDSVEVGLCFGRRTLYILKHC